MILDVPQLYQVHKDTVGYHVRQSRGRQRCSYGGKKIQVAFTMQKKYRENGYINLGSISTKAETVECSQIEDGIT